MGWRQTFDRRYREITERLPPTVAGTLDVLRPSYRSPWGGPLNGQARRQQIVHDLAAAIRFDRIIETGTHRGSTTMFLATALDARVDTVERSPRHFAYCKWRFALRPRVRVAHNDSRRFLTELAVRPTAPQETVFIYLDAHSGPDVPLVEELHIVGLSWDRAIVMIDDFEVPDDGGYDFHAYGPGAVLTASLLPAPALPGWVRFYPRAVSSKETGERRGCVVLASPALADAASGVVSLRSAGVL